MCRRQARSPARAELRACKFAAARCAMRASRLARRRRRPCRCLPCVAQHVCMAQPSPAHARRLRPLSRPRRVNHRRAARRRGPIPLDQAPQLPGRPALPALRGYDCLCAVSYHSCGARGRGGGATAHARARRWGRHPAFSTVLGERSPAAPPLTTPRPACSSRASAPTSSSPVGSCRPAPRPRTWCFLWPSTCSEPFVSAQGPLAPSRLYSTEPWTGCDQGRQARRA